MKKIPYSNKTILRKTVSKHAKKHPNIIFALYLLCITAVGITFANDIDNSNSNSQDLTTKKEYAISGDNDSAYYLYNYYLLTLHDEAEARKWLELAASRNHEAAMLNYSAIYFAEKVGDAQLANKYLFKVYLSKNCEIKLHAASLLGDLYSGSNFPNSNLNKAIFYYEFAAQYDDTHSLWRLTGIYKSRGSKSHGKAYFWEKLYFLDASRGASIDEKRFIKDKIRSNYENLNFEKIDKKVGSYIETMKSCDP